MSFLVSQENHTYHSNEEQYSIINQHAKLHTAEYGHTCTHHVGKGVAAAAIPAQVLLKVVLAGILGRAQKQHVLMEVGQSRPRRRILKMSRIDVDGTGLDVR